MGAIEQQTYDFQPSSLFGTRIPIPQEPVPTTDAALALDRQENMRRHKVYNTDYSQKKRPWMEKGFIFGKASRFPSSTAGHGDETEVVQSEEAAQ